MIRIPDSQLASSYVTTSGVGTQSVIGRGHPLIKLPPTLKLVIVEDEPSHARLVEIILRRIGVDNETHHLRSGTEALEYLFREGRYEDRPEEDLLVLLDLNLPGPNGTEVLRCVREDERTRTVPVIVVTSSDDDDERMECEALGASAYLTKPPSHEDLARAFREIGAVAPVEGG